jgi:beta-xylosidase
MKEGDIAGLSLLQRKYGLLAVKYEDGEKSLVMIDAASKEPVESVRIPLNQQTLFLKASCDFRERKDEANFFYSLNGKKWNKIGSTFQMQYTLPHFMGYRFGLFNYATESTGGYVDFDYFHITDQIH